MVYGSNYQYLWIKRSFAQLSLSWSFRRSRFPNGGATVWCFSREREPFARATGSVAAGQQRRILEGQVDADGIRAADNQSDENPGLPVGKRPGREKKLCAHPDDRGEDGEQRLNRKLDWTHDRLLFGRWRIADSIASTAA